MLLPSRSTRPRLARPAGLLTLRRVAALRARAVALVVVGIAALRRQRLAPHAYREF